MIKPTDSTQFLFTPSKSGAKRGFEGGYSLISVALFIVVLGAFMVPAIHMYGVWGEYNKQSKTSEVLQKIDTALETYKEYHGRYPCPATLTAAPDSAEFGVELADCSGEADVVGTEHSKGKDNLVVRTGAVPVRSLGLPDEMIVDAWRHRYVYAVTANLATDSGSKLAGAIRLTDINGNIATATDGNIGRLVLSMGEDARGAYNLEGLRNEVCDETSTAGENCKLRATYRNTINRSFSGNANQFTQMVRYKAVLASATCSGNYPKKLAYLLDTSGSMFTTQNDDGSPLQCPAGLTESLGTDKCSRMDVARWAMRRVVPARLEQVKTTPLEGATTGLTGFVGYDEAEIAANLGDITVADSVGVESKVAACPNGITPLGMHIQALADMVGDGTPGKPNAIMVVSDGLSNVGIDAVTVAYNISMQYPNLQINIIDVAGNPGLEDVARLTKGEYFASSKPDEILEKLFKMSGTCENKDLAPPKDEAGCGTPPPPTPTGDP